MPTPLLVMSHLRWNFVYQRPQHLMSRLARDRRILYVEEPEYRPELISPTWAFEEPEPQVLVCRPQSPVDAPGFSERQMQVIPPLLQALVQDQKLSSYVLWLYTPQALAATVGLQPTAVVYDCMDELSAFLHAPQSLRQAEQSLLQRADLVFTGGPSLYHSKKPHHPDVYCFPSSVDVPFFSAAKQPLPQPEDQARIPAPRLGFHGVIDERMDLALLDALATSHPEWNIVLVGPVVKIDPATLPRRSNIHYLGQKPYSELAHYLSGWDVCLLPFALNDATRYISPTKTLEYMAAEKPIVSTPITDVVEPYGRIVRIGTTHAEFIAACEDALSPQPSLAQERIELSRQVLSGTSWEHTAHAMSELVDQVLDRQRRQWGWGSRKREASPVVIVGAGPTGLSAAYHLGKDALLLEKNETVGGWCRSIFSRGFTFDLAGHIMFSNEPYVHEMYRRLLGDNVHWQDREAFIYSKGVYTRYPFQGCLHGLPPDVITECIMGAIEARYGHTQQAAVLEDAVARAARQRSSGAQERPADSQASQAGAGPSAEQPQAGEELSDCCADGVLESQCPLAEPASPVSAAAKEPANFEEFIHRVWGKGIARHFAIPYNRKLWAVPLTEMETSWLGGRVPMPDIAEMIRYALTPAAKPMGPNARFGYPLRGGFQSLMDGFLPYVQDQLRLGAEITSISLRHHTVRTADGAEYRYGKLISTMPLPKLVQMIGKEAPPEVRIAAGKLRHVSVRCVNLGIGRENISDKHWIYYPEDTVFHRIFLQGNASPYCSPPGGFGITCEITYSPDKPLPCDREALTQRCVEDCRRVGLIREDDPILTGVQVDLPYAYVVYDHGRPQHVRTIREFLKAHDVLLAGRYSEWEYYNSDHAFIAGRTAAEEAVKTHAPSAARSGTTHKGDHHGTT